MNDINKVISNLEESWYDYVISNSHNIDPWYRDDVEKEFYIDALESDINRDSILKEMGY